MPVSRSSSSDGDPRQRGRRSWPGRTRRRRARRGHPGSWCRASGPAPARPASPASTPAAGAAGPAGPGAARRIRCHTGRTATCTRSRPRASTGVADTLIGRAPSAWEALTTSSTPACRHTSPRASRSRARPVNESTQVTASSRVRGPMAAASSSAVSSPVAAAAGGPGRPGRPAAATAAPWPGSRRRSPGPRRRPATAARWRPGAARRRCCCRARSAPARPPTSSASRPRNRSGTSLKVAVGDPVRCRLQRGRVPGRLHRRAGQRPLMRGVQPDPPVERAELGSRDGHGA